MNHLDGTQDKNSSSNGKGVNNAQVNTPNQSIDALSSTPVVAKPIVIAKTMMTVESSDDKGDESTNADTNKAASTGPALPTKESIPTVHSPLQAQLPSMSINEATPMNIDDELNVPRSGPISTNLPRADAFEAHDGMLNTGGNGAKATSSSTMGVSVPPLPSTKRKSPTFESSKGDDSDSNSKKQKVDTAPIHPPPASLPASEPAPEATSDPTPTGNEISGNILATKEVQKPPIPSFSTPPGQTSKEKSASNGNIILPNSTRATATTKASSPANGFIDNSNKPKEELVTISASSTEGDTDKQKNSTLSNSLATTDENKEKKDAENVSSSSVPTSTATVNKPAPPSTTTRTVAPKNSNINAHGIIGQYKKYPPLKWSKGTRPLKSLTTSERVELERLFGIDKRNPDGNTWDDHWFGVLNLYDADVENPDGREGERQKKRPLLEWVGLNTKFDGKNNTIPNNSLKLMNNLLRYVYNYQKVPEQAKLILASINMKDPVSIGDAIQRLTIDPIVLQQDGWTIVKTKEPQGVSGGPYWIGEKIWWQGYLGVVIAYDHDDEYGDLWKAIWVEDLATFDLEREELEDSRKRYERKKAASNEKKKKQLIYKALKNDNFQVDGIEHGIVLATSYARGAKHGVFWPARVMHASELVSFTGRRSKNKKKVDVAFYAPYWNAEQASATNSARRTEPFPNKISRHSESIFSSGPMIEIESVDANDSCIQKYPYDAETGLDIDSLRSTFKFMGLPSAVFPRFLDSQRIALGLKTFSQTELNSTRASDSDRTSAALLEGHPLAVQAPHFPASVLQLPFDHILSQLPHHESRSKEMYNETSKGEPALRFDKILEAMKPPICWGSESNVSSHVKETPQLKSFITSPVTFLDQNKGTKEDPYNISRFLTGLLSLQSLLSVDSQICRMLKNSLNELVGTFARSSKLQDLQKAEARKTYTKSLNRTWVIVKSKGETLILAALRQKKFTPFLKDWRRCCERIYKHINVGLGSNGKSWVITDSRCNLHLTSSECVERAVRLPAALKGIRLARGNIEIIHTVEDAYLNLAEEDILPRAHKMSYIQKIKKRCMAAAEDQVVALTDDSDGNGGEDTKGSKGTWNAALLGVGAALKGLDMIINGECLNVFCATRPPGHHAGRDLHPMKAVSNGFCILNSVACAALYATAPIADGGLGLSRVCVIDIDVHHGNGTQDILCSTYDPRFLYVSMHAGGPDFNGLDIEDDELEHVELHLGGDEQKGIFPGRCGDVSPHKGVLNIPLGGRVTSHALGTALVTKVTPAVDAFSPEVIIISAGFDAHKNDPLNMGGLTAEDFGTLTEVICKLAYKCCSGRVLSVMEGGYGVPCCRPQKFGDQRKDETTTAPDSTAAINDSNTTKQPQQISELQCLDLGSDIPPTMMDLISSYALARRLNKCHEEGFVHCVKEHVSALARCNIVKR